MSQRRGAVPRSGSDIATNGNGGEDWGDHGNDDHDVDGEDEDEDPLLRKAWTVRSLQLEPADAEDLNGEDADDDADGEVARHHARVRHWRASPFACGLVEPTWAGQRTFHRRLYGAADTARDESGCLCCSARLCPLLGAGRIGHMVVLRSSHEWVEELEVDGEFEDAPDAEAGGSAPNGGVRRRRYTRPRLDCVVGPYWPMLVTVTYPLILGVSGWVFLAKVWPGSLHPALALAWLALTAALVAALALTACRDPGILYRHERPPPQLQADGDQWRWSEAALSYRPRTAVYDPDTAVVVEGFDHTCPWTGTAIGKKNMLAFQCFVSLVFIMLMMDIFLLTGVMDRHYLGH